MMDDGGSLWHFVRWDHLTSIIDNCCLAGIFAIHSLRRFLAWVIAPTHRLRKTKGDFHQTPKMETSRRTKIAAIHGEGAKSRKCP